MTQPTPDRIEAAVAAMRAESDLWDDLHERLNRCASQARGLVIDHGVDGFLFADFLATYNTVPDTFATRCTEGAMQAFSMGVALYSVARTYAAAEAGTLRQLQGQDGQEGPR